MGELTEAEAEAWRGFQSSEGCESSLGIYFISEMEGWLGRKI